MSRSRSDLALIAGIVLVVILNMAVAALVWQEDRQRDRDDRPPAVELIGNQQVAVPRISDARADPMSDEQAQALTHAIGLKMEKSGLLPPGLLERVKLTIQPETNKPYVAAVEWSEGATEILVVEWYIRSQPARGPWPLDLVHTIAHEYVHLGSIHYGDSGLESLEDVRSIEEGLGDAIAYDVSRSFCLSSKRGCSSQPWRTVINYPDYTANVRIASRMGSGAKTWVDRDSRVWRRSFLHAGSVDRKAMLEAAWND